MSAEALARIGSPFEDLEGKVALATAGGHVTGSTLPVDGGRAVSPL